MIKFSFWIFLNISIGLSLLSCGKVKNSSSGDAGAFVGTSEFVSAMEIISTKCMSCHPGWTGYTADTFVKKGLVFKGSPANSILYTRIRGNDIGQAGDMPPGQPNLSVSELREIKSWINSM